MDIVTRVGVYEKVAVTSELRELNDVKEWIMWVFRRVENLNVAKKSLYDYFLALPCNLSVPYSIPCSKYS